MFGKKNKTIQLTVRGMSCGHCEMRVKKALLQVSGVIDAQASHEQGQATVTVDAKQDVSVAALIAAVQSAGYEAELAA